MHDIPTSVHNKLKLASVNEEKLKAQLSLKWNDFNQSTVPEVHGSCKRCAEGRGVAIQEKVLRGPGTSDCSLQAQGWWHEGAVQIYK